MLEWRFVYLNFETVLRNKEKGAMIGLMYLLLIKNTIILSASGQTTSQIQVLFENEIKLDVPTQYVFTEPCLAINPTNEMHMVVGAMMINTAKGMEKDYGCIAMVTKDGGKTWSHFRLPVTEGADPWCLFTKEGTLLFTVLGLDSLYLFRSEDGGETFPAKPINLGASHDHETMTAAIVGDKEYIYISSIKGNSVYTAVSTDDGRSILSEKKLKFSNLNTNAMTAVALSDGTLVVPFSTFGRNGIPKYQRLKGAFNWLVKTKLSESAFSVPSFICESCDFGFPVLAVDKTTTSNQNRLYYVCSSVKDKAVYFHYSNDKGESWSSPLLIRNHISGAQEVRNPFTGIPSVTVNNKSVVGVTWQDRSGDSQNQHQFLYFTASIDGGLNFLPPVKVSKTPSHPDNEANGWAGERYRSGGDYTGFAAKQNGNFITVWSDARSGKFRLHWAEVKVN